VRPDFEKGRSIKQQSRSKPLLGNGRRFFVMDRATAEAEMIRIREAIDRVDEVLVKLLNQRARYAVEIGEIKGVLQLPIYAPEREKDVLRHVEEASQGPLAGTTVRRLFERIIDESRRVERESAHLPSESAPQSAAIHPNAG
jgi:chorismate mutase